PRAHALRGLDEAFPPPGQGKLLLDTSHAEKAFFFFKESPCISSAGIAFTTISYSSTSTKININHVTSPGERRVVTPGSAITRPTENICGNSTSLKTPQRGYYLSKLLCSLAPRKHTAKRY